MVRLGHTKAPPLKLDPGLFLRWASTARQIRKQCDMADRDMSGSLSKNTRKEKRATPITPALSSSRAANTGLNGWIKEGDNGNWLSLSAKPTEERRPANDAAGPRSMIRSRSELANATPARKRHACRQASLGHFSRSRRIGHGERPRIRTAPGDLVLGANLYRTN
jgi:hypothetical protein